MHGFIPNTFYRVSVKAIIRGEQGKILAVKELLPKFSLPGGGIDHGESIRECLARELFEEVGLRQDFTHTLVGAKPFYVDEAGAWFLWLIYEVTTEQTDFVIGEGVSEMKFLSPDEFDSTSRAGSLAAELLR